MNSTKTMTTSAIMVALAVVFSLILYFIPFFQFALFLIGIPIVLLGKVSDLKMQLLASVVVLLILGFIDPTYALLVGFIVLPSSIAQGYMIKKEHTYDQIIGVGTLFIVFGCLGVLYSLNVLLSIDFINELQIMVDTTVDQAKALYSTMDLASNDLNTMHAALEQMRTAVVFSLPSFLVMYSFVTSILSFVISKKIFARLQLPIKKAYFKDYRINKQGRLILMIVLGMITLLSIVDKSSSLYFIGNFMAIFNLILQINALALMWYLLEKHPRKKFMRVSLMILFFIAPLMPGLNLLRYILSFIGFADLYIDFRMKLESRSK